MTKLRTILAENLRVYRNEMGFSQAKLAELVDTAPNYIAMIEASKRFPTDTMLEKIAVALQKEPIELFSTAPLQKQWQETLLEQLQKALLVDFADFMALKKKELQKETSDSGLAP